METRVDAKCNLICYWSTERNIEPLSGLVCQLGQDLRIPFVCRSFAVEVNRSSN